MGVGTDGPDLAAISAQLKAAAPQIKAKGLEMPKQPEILSYSAPSDVTGEPEEPVLADEIEVGPALAQAAASHDHPLITAKGLDRPKQPQNLSYSAPSEVGEAEVTGAPQQVSDDPYAGASRNAECPCGSGKKYKKCHGAPGGPTGLTTRVNG